MNNIDLTQAREILAKRSVWFESIYNKEGKIHSIVSFSRSGIKENEVLYLPEKDSQVIRYSHKNRSLRAEMFREQGIETGTYKEWNEKGELTKFREFDEHGKIKKKLYEIIKNLNLLPQPRYRNI